MKRLLSISTAVACAAGLTACGGGDSTPVEGTDTSGTPATTAAAVVDVKKQEPKLATCLKGPVKGKLAVFAPTAKLATDEGGQSFSTAVAGSGVELILFPNAAAAQQGYKDAQNRLILLQQTQPAQYKKLAATAMEVQLNVLVIAPKGLAPAAAQPLASCVAQSQ